MIASQVRDQVAEALMGARVSWSGPHHREFPPGKAFRDTVVPTDRLIYLEEGSLAYRVEEQNLSCSKGMLWLIPAWTRRSWRTEAGCRIRWLEFSLLPQLISLPVIVGTTDLPLSLEEIFGQKQLLLQEMGFKHYLMHQIMHGEWKSIPDAGDKGICEITRIMRKHLHECDLMVRLPGIVGLTPQQMRSHFRKALGTTPRDYLEALRMQHARYLLMTTPTSIKEVAYRVGFEDPLYFSRRYRSFWNQSPKAHRGAHS